MVNHSSIRLCHVTLAQGFFNIVDHDLVLWPLHFTSRKKNVKVTMQLEVPKKLISCLRYPLSWSIGLCCERYIRVSLVAIVKGTWQKVVFVCFFVFIYLFLCIFLYPFFLPNVIVTKRKEGRKKGRDRYPSLLHSLKSCFTLNCWHGLSLCLTKTIVLSG